METLVDIEAIYEAKVETDNEHLKIRVIGGCEELEWALELRAFLPDKATTWLDPRYPLEWKGRLEKQLSKLRGAIDEAIRLASEIAKERREKYGCALFKRWKKVKGGRMDLVIDLAEIEKVKAKIWEEKVEVQLIGKDWTNEIVLRCYTDNYEREATAKLKELLAAVAKVLGYLDPQGEVGLVEVECRHCDGLSDYPVVAQDLFYEARKEVEGAA